MASDLLRVLDEVRGTGAPGAEYNDGIYWDIAIKDYNSNPGMYGDILYMSTEAGKVIANINDIATELELIVQDFKNIYNRGIKVNYVSLFDENIETKATFFNQVLKNVYGENSFEKIENEEIYIFKVTE